MSSANTAEIIRELRSLAVIFRSGPEPNHANVRLVVATAVEVAATGPDPIIDLRIRLLRRRAVAHAARVASL